MLKNHIRAAVRFFRKNAAFTSLNFAGLAASFTAALILIAYINFQFSYDDFHPEGEKLYRVQIGNDNMAPKTHPALAHALAERFPDCQVTRLKRISGSIGADEQAFQEEKVYWADHTFLTMFGYSLVAGDRQEALLKKNTAVITEKLASRLFENGNAMGKMVTFVDNYNKERTFEVTGILADVPGNSHLTFTALFSYGTLDEATPDYQYGWSWRGVYTYLKTTRTEPSVVEAFYQDLAARYKNIPNISLKADDRMHLMPARDIHLHVRSGPDAENYGNIDIVYFLAGFVILLFTISVFNYINLTAVSAAFRYKEIGVKKIVGARAGQIIRQFLVEAILLYGAAFVLSIIVLSGIFTFVNDVVPVQHPFFLFTDVKVIALIIFTVAAGIGVSCVYTFFLLNKAQPVGLLKNNVGQLRANRPAQGLMITQFIVTIVLLVATNVIQKQIDYMRSKELGITIDQVVIIKPPQQGGDKPDQGTSFMDKAKGLPSVETVTRCSQVPGRKINFTWWGVSCADKRFVADENAEYAIIESDENFLNTFRLKLTEGRNLAPNDSGKVLVNQTSLKLLGLRDASQAIHQNIVLGNETFQIIGVVSDYHHLSLKETILPVIISNSPSATVSYAIKLNTPDVRHALSDIRQAWKAAHGDAVFDYYFLDAAFDGQYQDDVRFGKAIGILTTTVLVIAYLGVIGTLIFVTYRRAKEISIRRVLGSDDFSIVYLFFKSIAKQVLFASVVALPLAFYMMGIWIERYPYRIDLSPDLFLLPVLFIFFIVLLAVCLIVYKILHYQRMTQLLKTD